MVLKSLTLRFRMTHFVNLKLEELGEERLLLLPTKATQQIYYCSLLSMLAETILPIDTNCSELSLFPLSKNCVMPSGSMILIILYSTLC